MKRILKVLIPFFVVVMLFAPFAADAQTSTSTTLNQLFRRWDDRFPRVNHNQTQEHVVMNADGHFRVTGVVVNSVSSSTNTVNVSFFGFTRNVELRTQAGGVTPIWTSNGVQVGIGDLRAGDRLSAHGHFDRSTRAIHVEEIIDVSLTRTPTTDIQARLQQLLEMVRQLQTQLQNLISNR